MLTAADLSAGYQHRLSIWQLEVSRTQVFDRPVQGRHFFEAVIRENLDLGRPDRISLLFPTRLTHRTPAPAHGYRTRVITSGIAPSLHVAYKHTDVKQYFKGERVLRFEAIVHNTRELGCGRVSPRPGAPLTSTTSRCAAPCAPCLTTSTLPPHRQSFVDRASASA